MKKVYQTLFSPEEGNCFAACIASVLELSLDEVPNYHIPAMEGDDRWWHKTQIWLSKRNLALVEFKIADGDMPNGLCGIRNNVFCLIAGLTQEHNCPHSVVGRYKLDKEKGEHRLEFVHDPNPKGTFLKEPAIAVAFFAVINPAKPILT